MIKKLCSLIAIATVGGALVAGCGSSSSSSSSPAATPASSSSASTSSSAAPTSSSSGGSAASNPAVVAAVAQCKASINAAPNLSAAAKSKLVGFCDQAANGNPANLKKITAQVCQQIVKDTVPASSQAAALAACPKG